MKKKRMEPKPGPQNTAFKHNPKEEPVKKVKP